MHLFELSEQYNTLLDLLQEDTDNEQLQIMLGGLEGKIEEKIENTVLVMKTLEAEADIIDAEIKRLSQRKASIKNNAERLKQNIESTMRNLEISKIKGKFHTVSFKKNPPKLNILDENAIDESYFNIKTERALDKRRLLEDMKNDNYFGFGVEVIQEVSLSIK